uniref:(northern house mosquito) hypothetical protein n=1 Tax=Culex pipiens TaxID=7175 RepID=A0A8D8C8C9_CULPI
MTEWYDEVPLATGLGDSSCSAKMFRILGPPPPDPADCGVVTAVDEDEDQSPSMAFDALRLNCSRKLSIWISIELGVPAMSSLCPLPQPTTISFFLLVLSVSRRTSLARVAAFLRLYCTCCHYTVSSTDTSSSCVLHSPRAVRTFTTCF